MNIEKGTLVRWIDDKGFGFIKPDNGNGDIFIHISALKGMSRSPVIGDVIHFQTSLDNNGKTRAINASIEGVAKQLSLVTIAKTRKATTPAPRQEHSYRNYKTVTARRQSWFGILPILLIVVGAVYAYDKFASRNSSIVQTEATAVDQPRHTQQFQCLGKVHCSEMSSYEEADFYLHNCPGTKMDGDGDGIPCEQQF